MPLTWIIAFHSTSCHLLISMVHFSHCNSRLPLYLHISRVVLMDSVLCCLQQYQGCCCAALRSFLSVCWQVLPVVFACWWNASYLLHAVKHPYIPQPFQMCFIISVSIIWLVCTIAFLISHSHIHRGHGLDKVGKYIAILLSSCRHKTNGRWCWDVTLWKNTEQKGGGEVNRKCVPPKIKAVCSSTAVKWSDVFFLVFLSFFVCSKVPPLERQNLLNTSILSPSIPPLVKHLSYSFRNSITCFQYWIFQAFFRGGCVGEKVTKIPQRLQLLPYKPSTILCMDYNTIISVDIHIL